MIEEKNYDKFVFKGSLALESYFDENNKDSELFIDFNNKLTKYRSLQNKSINDTETIVRELLSIINKIGKENFIIYEDGDIEYIYGNMKGDDSNVKK